ncbi:hypothetical protein B0T25DRAFT_531028 [Lasiosphaeria hispida]|uniref:Uncharacterized protein n=1 Tax=Lasiosphaeria hispida TaxID=260671 RepID=A0AAJ0MH33_9PEZI|nr:hypothetical protein B0T25DRAFT_531028 [Lasiosphaeria hispida]
MLYAALRRQASWISALKEHPTSMDEFLAVADAVFSEGHLNNLALQANKFDAVSGFSALSDCFMSSRPATDSIKDIIWAIAAHAAAQSAEEIIGPNQSSASSGTNDTPGQQQPPPLPETAQPAPDQQSSSGRLLTEDEEGNMPCRIQQISLEGPTIAEAWRANATTNDMENLAVRVELNTDPSSMPFRALPVYHGTDWIIEDSERAIHDPRNGILRPTVNHNQVAPDRWALAVVWTGFSPLRCFLWAAFKAEVLHQIPTGTVKAKLQHSWNCLTSASGSGSPPSPHTHTGVTLFKFRPSLPSAFGQTYYVMPKGREAEWERICRTHNEVRSDGEASTLVKRLWDHFTPIHGGTLQTWPHALHCHEFGDQLTMLRWYSRQLWKTVWFGQGVNTLNESHEATFAISFKLTAPVPPKGSPKKDTQSHDK